MSEEEIEENENGISASAASMPYYHKQPKGVKRMRNKTIGITVIAFLLLSVATLVPATAIPTVTATPTVTETDFDTIDKVLLKYKDDLAEIDAYIEEYIAEYGAIDANFVLPDELQVKFDNIVNELSTTLGEICSLGGGKNDYRFSLQWWGFKLWLYLDHYWTTMLKYLGPIGVGGIAAIICLISHGTLAPFAVLAATLILGYGVTRICDKDRGNGVVIYMQYSLIFFIPDYVTAWSQ